MSLKGRSGRRPARALMPKADIMQIPLVGEQEGPRRLPLQSRRPEATGIARALLLPMGSTAATRTLNAAPQWLARGLPDVRRRWHWHW